MEAINPATGLPAWPGYPQAVTASGFCFISGIMGLNKAGELVSGWDELPPEAASLASGFASVDAVEGAAGAQSWAAFHQMRALMDSLGGDLDDVVQLHYYQKEKRLFPVFERVKRIYEPEAPAPGSGIGVCGGSGDGKAWFVIDGIAIDPRQRAVLGRRNVLRYSGEKPPGSHYSQAVQAGPYIFVAGHIPNDTSKPGNPVIQGYDDVPEEARFLRVGRSHPDTRDGLIAAQTWFTYDKIRQVLQAAGSGMEDIVNVTVFLQDMTDYHTFHRVHERMFPSSVPALTVTEFREVGHKGTRIEIEVTALKPGRLRRSAIRTVAGLDTGAHCAHATVAGPLVFASGQVGVGSDGRAVKDLAGVAKPFAAQAAAIVRATGRQEATCQAFAAYERLRLILKEAGCDFRSVARLIVYLQDFADFVPVDLVTGVHFPDQKPALSCVTIPRVSPIPGTRICLEATAVKE